VQLLELGAALILLAGSSTLLAVGTPRGTIFAFALTGYAAARVAIDPLRERPTHASAGRPVALATFIACSVVASALGWVTMRN
jgi:prolipoprotein diacylglyceryltransferase